MRKIIYLICTIATILIYTPASSASQSGYPDQDVAPPRPGTSTENSCNITCYEKTPSCYISKDKHGCLDITNDKPKCTDNSCVCTVKSCDKKTNY